MDSLNIKVAVETAAHNAIQRVLDNIAAEYGIQVHDIHAVWLEDIQMGHLVYRVHELKVSTSKTY